MINRLVAQNTLKLPFKGLPFFSVSKKLLAFQTDNSIRIKTIGRQAKDLDIPFNKPPIQFFLSLTQPWLYLLTSQRLLEIYQVQYIQGLQEGSFKKTAILHNVESLREIKSGIVLVASNKTIKTITFAEIGEQTEINLNIDSNKLKSIAEADKPFVLTADQNSQRIYITRCGSDELKTAVSPITEIFDKAGKVGKYQRSITLSYLKNIVGVYKQRFVFQLKAEQQVQIYDVEQSKLVGKFQIEGEIKYSQIRDNLLLIVSSKQSADYLHFFVLNLQPSSRQPLVTNRVIYQKGKGDYYKLFNMQSVQAALVLDKKKNAEITDNLISKITDNTSSILYILNKSKEKVQIIKLDHSKLLKSPFGEEKLEMVVYSKKQDEADTNPSQKVDIERSRIHSSIELKTGEKNLQELQKKFVQNLIDIKLKNVMKKFSELERKVQNLQMIIKNINEKIQINFEKINRKEIRENVQKMFEKLTPQFQKYFSQIFKQVAGVLDQGVTYYNMKLAKEAEMHKDALAQIVGETFKATQEITEIGRKEQAISEKTQEHLKKLLQTKRKWTKSTEQYEAKVNEIPNPVLRGPSGTASVQGQSEGKVFVRADLNYPSSKRQT